MTLAALLFSFIFDPLLSTFDSLYFLYFTLSCSSRIFSSFLHFKARPRERDLLPFAKKTRGACLVMFCYRKSLKLGQSK